MSITGQPGGTSARLAAIPHRDCGHIGAQAGRIWPAAIAGLLGSARRGVARALAAVASALAAVGVPPRIAPADLGRPEVNRTRGDLGNRSERALSAALRFGVSPNPDVAAAADARAALVRQQSTYPPRAGRHQTGTRINLALQGGGTHGAFTWGVLDRLFEEPDLEIIGISGASAGAVNAVVAASGLASGGREGARAALAVFWERVAAEARLSPLIPTPLERAMDLDRAGLAAGQVWLEGVARVASPYDLDPSGHNPLADLLVASVDFERLRLDPPVKLFVSATNVRTGKVRIFGPDEINLEAVLASACLPQLFHAVEIDGEHYWDGGYAANPPVLPLVEDTDCEDIVIVQVDPVRIRDLPTTARAIRERVQVLAFNAGFLREMHEVAGNDRVRLHLIAAEAAMARLGAASKLDADQAFLERLFRLGRRRAGVFLARHKAEIGARSSLDVAARFL
jgi:NTE family protein